MPLRLLLPGLLLSIGGLASAQEASTPNPPGSQSPTPAAVAPPPSTTDAQSRQIAPANTPDPAVSSAAETAPQTEPAAPLPLLPSDPQILGKLVQTLSPPNRRRFAELLSSDWQDAPEWGVMMISLLKGEPMGPGAGWYRPSQKRFDWSWLANQFDKNADGTISRDEIPESAPYASILFNRLDRDADGRIRPVDFDYLSRQQPTPPLMMSQFLTQLLDGDLNGRITIAELQELIARADKDQTGFLTIEDLQRDFTRAFADMSNSTGEEMPSPDAFVSMFFNGELGTMESGPDLGEPAPDFTLPTHDGARSVTLSQTRGKPVILIFGSFT
ncbi:MAG: hypothetical protein EHM42_00715 [Planctomycetaceae bacterium]|nr:MAG: hypothetical protein EHM42_00715 [Planctomycetaceae bacterium]